MSKKARTERRRFTERIGRVVDTVMMDLAPSWGKGRKASRMQVDLAEKRAAKLAADWDATDDNRTRGDRWMTSRLSPESQLEENLKGLRDRSRDEVKKDCYACGAVESAVTNEVGQEIRPQGRIVEVPDLISADEAKRFNDENEDIYRRWAPFAFANGMSMAEGQQLACRTWKTDGESFIFMTGKGKADKPVPLALKLIDADCVDEPPAEMGTNNARLGIECDADGEPTRYWVRTTIPGDNRNTSEQFVPFEADRICHLFTPLRVGQRRGIPWLTPALPLLKDLKDLREYELIKRQIAACFSVFITTPDADGTSDYRKSGTNAAGYRIEEIEPGRVEYVDEGGAKVDFAQPTHDNSNFGAFLEGMLRAISSALNFPYELLAKDYSLTTYSSGRLSLIDGRIVFRMHQRLMMDRWLCKVWNEVIRQAVAVGESSIDPMKFNRNPAAFMRHGWVTSGWPWIDPVKEVAAAKMAIDNNLSTLTDELVAQGRDPEEQAAKRRNEIDVYADQGIDILPVAPAAAAQSDSQPDDKSGAASKKERVAA